MTGIDLSVVDTFDYDFSTEEHTWIPLSDGIRLSVKLWKPRAKSPGEAFPVVLEAIPYRKDDVSLWDDSVRMEYFAGNGYLCARLDLRESGDSEGALADEYSMREQLDIVEAIAWLADLPESNGRVGMTGISWSGFNSLQVAQHRPSALKAIITVCSTDDRYDNDVHYMGGSLLGFYQNWWGSIMHEFNLRPADPRIVGDAWRPMQAERMNANPFLTSIWLAHQNRDAYWKPGSICENYSALDCAVLAVGGWADGYTDAIARLVDNCSCVAKGIIGPWGHTWPERGIPGPGIGFLQECLRWWDCWLKDIENGAQDDPKMRYYLQGPCALTPDCDYRAGSWMQTAEFTRNRPAAVFKFGLDGHRAPALVPAGGESDGAGAADRFISHSSDLTVGTQVDTWLPMGSPIDLPSEQTPDDVRSLCFDGPVLEEPLDVVGQPLLSIAFSVDKPEAHLFARLCDVWPDGTSHLITRGNMNLTHYASHEFPESLVPDRTYRVEIPLKAVAQTIPAGHRVRLALSTSYWPWIWPSREKAAVTIDMPASSFRMPVAGAEDRPIARPFEGPRIARGESCETLKPGKPFTRRAYDSQTGELVFERSTDDDSLARTPSGFVFGSKKSTKYAIREDDPLSARMESVRESIFQRDGWKIETNVYSSMSCTFNDFIVETDTVVRENGKVVHDERHTETIPRFLN
jgi:putative CocE/NonD family hydrolase